MKTPYHMQWIDLAALGPEDEDAELRALVSVELDDVDDAVRLMRHRAAFSTGDWRCAPDAARPVPRLSTSKLNN